MNGSNPAARTVRSYFPGVRNWAEKFPSASVARSRFSPVPWLLMTTAASGTSAPLGSLTAPAIAPVLAVWAWIGGAQSASTEARSKVLDAWIEMFHISSFLHNHQSEARRGSIIVRIWGSGHDDGLGRVLSPIQWRYAGRGSDGAVARGPAQGPDPGAPTATVREYED